MSSFRVLDLKGLFRRFFDLKKTWKPLNREAWGIKFFIQKLKISKKTSWIIVKVIKTAFHWNFYQVYSKISSRDVVYERIRTVFAFFFHQSENPKNYTIPKNNPHKTIFFPKYLFHFNIPTKWLTDITS